MNIALLVLGVIFVVTSAVLAERLEAANGNPVINQDRYSRFKLPLIDRNLRNFVECSKKTNKVIVESGSAAYFRSPDYPNDYPSKTTCRWQFNSEEDITIQCLDIDLERSKKGKCINDILTIDHNEYCGSHTIVRYNGYDSINVQFKSSKKKNHSGFYCIVHVTSDGPPTDEPSWPCECGQSNNNPYLDLRIVGGKETQLQEYPWVAALVYKDTTEVFCGGSIISSKHILTAANCSKPVNEFQVLVGAHYLKYPSNSQRRLNPDKFIKHKKFDSTSMDNDIAIIQFKSHIIFSREINPVCLPTVDEGDEDESTGGWVVGWGHKEEGGNNSGALREVWVNMMNNSKCKEFHGEQISDNMLCAGRPKKGNRDFCQNDSGGPFLRQIWYSFEQIGVVSWGVGCGRPKSPGVYTRVAKYLPWISAKTSSSKKCPMPEDDDD